MFAVSFQYAECLFVW